MAGPVAGPVHEPQHFAGVRQCQHQGVVAPDPFVVDVDPLLALRSGLDHGAVGFDPGFGEELVRLPRPDLPAGVIEGVLQRVQIFRPEPPAEVSGRGRVGNPLRSQQVQIGFVLPPDFEVFQTLTVTQSIVGQAENVIRLVVRQIGLEQMQAGVDRLGQLQFLNQLVHQPDAAIPRSHCPPGQFVLRRGWPHHRL